MTFPLGSLYHGTKFAVEGISESLRYEVEQFGGKVKIVEPGAIATDFAGRSFDFNHNENLSAYNNIVNDRARLGRLVGADVLLVVSITKNRITQTRESITAYGMTENIVT